MRTKTMRLLKSGKTPKMNQNKTKSTNLPPVKVAFILFPETILSGLFGALDILNWANILYGFKNATPYFQIELYASSPQKIKYTTPGYFIKKIPTNINADLILIPGVSIFQFKELTNYFQKEASTTKLQQIIKRQLKENKPVMVCCTSTILLATLNVISSTSITSYPAVPSSIHKSEYNSEHKSTYRSSDKSTYKSTVKWWFKEEAQKHFPHVQFNTTLPIIKDRNIWSCATAFTSFEMILFWIEELWGPKLTTRLKQYLSFETHQYLLAQASVLTPWSQTPNEIVQIEKWLQSHIFEPIQVKDLAKQFGYSVRTLNRKIKSHLGQSPKDWIIKIRMDAAKIELERSAISIEELSHKYGYQDSSSFRKAFIKIVGLSPKAYQLSRSQRP